MRANTNIARKERQTVTLTDFRGVDLTTSPLRVTKNRATYMRNLINDHGINHKRPGWRELLHAVGVDKGINGIFPYKNGDHDVLLIHAGTDLYAATYDAATGMLDVGESIKTGLSDTRSQCVYRGGFAYILGCGDFLTYGKHDGSSYSLKSVTEIAYVPTTTVSINESTENDAVKGSLDPVNRLTRTRKNTLVGQKILEGSVDGQLSIVGGNYGIWWLDGSVDQNRPIVIEIEGKSAYPMVGSTVFKYVPYICRIERGEGENAKNLYIKELTTGDNQNKIYDGSETSFRKVGDYVGRTNTASDGRSYVELSIPTQPLIEGTPNITVTFDAEGNDTTVQGCCFGALFGTNGASDRLFVGGNPDHPDMDFWSEMDDFTYFPDGNTMAIGGDQRPVTGYARLSDSTLAIFKESLVGEPSIYYRTGKTTTQIDADGDTVPADYFPVTAGTAGEGSVSHHAVANLAGDVLILSPEGVRGIELSANVSSGERYTRDRGRAIYEDLRHRDLSEAVATVWRGRYLLACGDGVCYVADSRYRATFEGSPDTGYEWWVWDNVPARVFAVWDDKLLFGTKKGTVCVFEEGSFADRECLPLESGAVLVAEGGTLDYADNLELKEGDRVVLTGGVYELLADGITVTNGVCDGNLIGLRDGSEVFADNVGDSGLALDTAYFVDMDVNAGTFTLTTSKGEAVTPAAGGFRLLAPLDGIELYVADESDPATLARGYSVSEDGERVWNTVFLTTYDSSTSNWTGRYMQVYPVKAEWVTPVMDLGTNMYSKSLLSLTVATEPGIDGTVTFGYETRRVLRHLETGRALAVSTEEGATVVGGGEGFSFNDLDFSQFSFDTSFACSYTRRMHLRNFNFITFRFGSECDRDCAVSSAVAVYKINRKNMGVR